MVVHPSLYEQIRISQRTISVFPNIRLFDVRICVNMCIVVRYAASPALSIGATIMERGRLSSMASFIIYVSFVAANKGCAVNVPT